MFSSLKVYEIILSFQPLAFGLGGSFLPIYNDLVSVGLICSLQASLVQQYVHLIGWLAGPDGLLSMWSIQKSFQIVVFHHFSSHSDNPIHLKKKRCLKGNGHTWKDVLHFSEVYLSLNKTKRSWGSWRGDHSLNKRKGIKTIDCPVSQ